MQGGDNYESGRGNSHRFKEGDDGPLKQKKAMVEEQNSTVPIAAEDDKRSHGRILYKDL
jgi:hypothetical protein